MSKLEVNAVESVFKEKAKHILENQSYNFTKHYNDYIRKLTETKKAKRGGQNRKQVLI